MDVPFGFSIPESDSVVDICLRRPSSKKQETLFREIQCAFIRVPVYTPSIYKFFIIFTNNESIRTELRRTCYSANWSDITSTGTIVTTTIKVNMPSANQLFWEFSAWKIHVVSWPVDGWEKRKHSFESVSHCFTPASA